MNWWNSHQISTPRLILCHDKSNHLLDSAFQFIFSFLHILHFHELYNFLYNFKLPFLTQLFFHGLWLIELCLRQCFLSCNITLVDSIILINLVWIIRVKIIYFIHFIPFVQQIPFQYNLHVSCNSQNAVRWWWLFNTYMAVLGRRLSVYNTEKHKTFFFKNIFKYFCLWGHILQNHVALWLVAKGYILRHNKYNHVFHA